jgi:SAM-dependent methyltransferase
VSGRVCRGGGGASDIRFMAEIERASSSEVRRRRPNAAPDPASLTREAYVKLQLDRSRLKASEDCSFRATHLLGIVRDLVGEAGWSGLSSVLCVGCRNGRELDAASAAGFSEVVGIDLHSLDPRIEVMDMHGMSFPDGRFDVVLASHVLEHALAPSRAASEFCRVTRPGGYVVIEVPIFYGTFGADLWDFESPAGVAALLGGGAEVVWSEEGRQLDGPQEVARVVARVGGGGGR